jgi:hypothetical protein
MSIESAHAAGYVEVDGTTWCQRHHGVVVDNEEQCSLYHCVVFDDVDHGSIWSGSHWPAPCQSVPIYIKAAPPIDPNQSSLL